MTDWVRPFRITTPRAGVFHGAQFPNGSVVVISQRSGLMSAAVTLEALEIPADATIEWMVAE